MHRLSLDCFLLAASTKQRATLVIVTYEAKIILLSVGLERADESIKSTPRPIAWHFRIAKEIPPERTKIFRRTEFRPAERRKPDKSQIEQLVSVVVKWHRLKVNLYR